MLSDKEIKIELNKPFQEDPLIIHPLLDTQQIYCSKVDLRIDNELFRLKQGLEGFATIDPDAETYLNKIADKIICPYGRNVVIVPRELLFAYTYEYVRMPDNLVGHIEARARLAKLGLIVSSGLIDPGYSDHIFLSFTNVSSYPMIIRPLMRVASLTIEKIDTVETGYQKRRFVRRKLDPDQIELANSDYDSDLLKEFSKVTSDDVVARRNINVDAKSM